MITMGTTTFYLKHNDLGRPLNQMSKNDLELLSRLTPYGKDNSYLGWKIPFELHNGNIYVLIFWKGRLMKLEDAPKNLNRKNYNKYKEKTLRKYEWTVLRRLILNEVECLNKYFKNNLRKKKHGTR